MIPFTPFLKKSCLAGLMLVVLLIVVVLFFTVTPSFAQHTFSLTPTGEPTEIPTDIPAATNTPFPTDVPAATNTPFPTDVPAATNTPFPTDIPAATNTPFPTDIPAVTNTPFPTDIPAATNTPTNLPTLTPLVSEADPWIKKRVDKTKVALGDVVTYSIVVVNRGSTSATDVVVRDPLPLFLTYMSAGSTRGTPSYVGGVVALNLGDLQPDEEVVLTIQARINSMPNSMINVASLTTTSKTDNPTNNEDRISILTVEAAPPAARVVPTPAPRFPNTGGSALAIPSLWLVGGAGLVVAMLSLVALLLALRSRRARSISR